MSQFSKLLLALTLLVSSFAQANANDWFWLTLSVKFQYQDLYVACSGQEFSDKVYLAAQFSSDHKKLKRILFTKSYDPKYYPYTRKVELTQEEIASLHFDHSSGSQHWLNSLELNTRLFHWLLESTGHHPFCPPKTFQPLPSSPVFKYDLAPEVNPSAKIPSEILTVKGTRVDGRPFKVFVRITQSQLRP